MKRIARLILLATATTLAIAAFAQSGNEGPSPKPNLTSVAGKAVVMIYRNDAFLFVARPVNLFVGGSSIGNIVGTSYVRLVVPPGKYVFGATAVGGSAKITLDAERDKVYYIWLDAQMAFPVGPKPLLAVLDEAQGKSDLEKCGCTEAEGMVTDTAELGLSTPTKGDDVHQRLQTLKRLFDNQLITKEEYEAKRKQILDGL